MNPVNHSKLYLPGSTDRVSQLNWVSLADGGSNAVMGYNSGKSLTASQLNNTLLGTNVATKAKNMTTSVLVGAAAAQRSDRISDTVAFGCNVMNQAIDVTSSVLIGSSAGTKLRRTSQCVAVGYKAMEAVADGTRNVALGAMVGSSATNISNVVLVGTECATNARRLSNVVVLGYQGAVNMQSCDATVAVGSGVARNFTGNYNTIVGADCALNVASQYSTIVGSRNMNRRQNQLVQLENTVVVGENIRFDNPSTTITLRSNDAISYSVAGPAFYDSTHLFPDPYLDFGGGGSGRILYELEESRGENLLESERYLTFFNSLRVEDGAAYTTSWDIHTVSEQLAVEDTPPYQYALTASSANSRHISATMNVLCDGTLVATKTYTDSHTLIDISSLPVYCDVSVTMANAQIAVVATLYQGSAPLSTTENSEVTLHAPGIWLANASASGFTLENIRSTQAYTGTSYWELVGGPAAYTILQHIQRVDVAVVYSSYSTKSEHTSTSGAVDLDRGNGVLDIILVDEDAGRTGSVDALYNIGTYNSTVLTTASFCLTNTSGAPGRIGLEILDEYRLECTVDTLAANALTMSLVSTSSETVLFDCTQTLLYAAFKGSIGGPTIPIDLAPIRAAAQDIWAVLEMMVYTDAPRNGVQMHLKLHGYSATGYLNRQPPLISRDYYFSAVDPSPPIPASLYNRTTANVFAEASSGTWSVRDISIQNATYRPSPQFTNCVFLGSNFSIDNPLDRSNVFLLSLGPAKTLLRGTPNIFEVYSPASIKGSLLLGDSPSHNYLAFRGTVGDGFLEQYPTTYIGERIYEASTQKSELLLFKGDNPAGELGPDRVRVLSGHFRIESPLQSANSTYIYPGTTFDSVGQTETQPLLVADPDAGTQFLTEGNGFLGFTLVDDSTLQLTVRGTDGISRSHTLALS